MIERIVKKGTLSTHDEAQQNLRYWLSRTPAERLAEVERLRVLRYGTGHRLERVVRIRHRKSRRPSR